MAVISLEEFQNRWVLKTKNFGQKSWQKIEEAAGEKLSTFYLIQKGNAVSVRGCPKNHHHAFHVQEAEMLW